MRKRRSKKRSGTSSRRAGALPELPPIYVDESLSQRFLPDKLRAHGLRVIARADRFPAGVTDPEWLGVAGAEGWVVLTKDKAIRHRTNELQALINSGVRAFALAAGEMTGPEQAELFGRIIPVVRKMVAELPSGPFVVRITKDGTCDLLEPRDDTETIRRQRRRRLKNQPR